MYGAAADRLHEGVAGLLDQQAALHHRAVFGGHRDRAVVAQEVRRMEHVHVERVALQPLAAVQEPPQVPDRPVVDRDPAGVLHRPHGAGLVGDRADAADPRRDVRRLRERAPAQEGLEEAGRLIDAQLHVGHAIAVDADVHRALALDPGQGVNLDRARHPPPGSAPALNVRYTRTRSRSSSPRSRSRPLSACVSGVSIGPKQP